MISATLPVEWRLEPIAELHAGDVPQLNPLHFPDEHFEHFSIPAYQNAETPELVKGSAILSQKLAIPQQCVLFGKLNPRVQKVWNVRTSNEFRRVASTEWLPILPREGNDQDYIYYLMWSDWVMPVAQQLVSGSTPSRQRVEPKAFYEIEVPVPEIEEQRQIAGVLRLVQEQSRLQSRYVQTLQDLKRAAMHTLFTRGLRGEAQKETEIGPLPESWRVVRVEEHANTLSKGSSPKWQGFDYVEDGILFVRSQNVGNGVMEWQDKTFLPPAWNEQERRSVLQSGDVLVNLVGASIGRSAVGGPEIEGANCNQAVCFVRLIQNEVIPGFLNGFLLTPQGQAQIHGKKKDIARANLSLQDVRNVLMPKPPINEQRDTVAILDAIDRKIDLHRRKRVVLEDLFKALLHKLMTGELRVGELDITKLSSV